MFSEPKLKQLSYAVTPFSWEEVYIKKKLSPIIFVALFVERVFLFLFLLFENEIIEVTSFNRLLSAVIIEMKNF